MKKKSSLLHFAIALGFANICYFRNWDAIFRWLYPTNELAAYLLAQPSGNELIALLANIAVLTIVLFFLLQFPRTPRMRRFVSLILVLILLQPLNHVRHEYAAKLFSQMPRTLVVAFFAFVVGMAIWQRRHMESLAQRIGLCLIPVVGLFAIKLAPNLGKFTFGQMPELPRKLASTNLKQNVLWLIFDELSQEAAFSRRFPGIELPELDRLAAHSLAFQNAYAPADRTLLSMPSYLTGENVVKAWPTESGRDLGIQFKGNSNLHSWQHSPGLMTSANQLGYETGIIGSYHPYCRVLYEQLTHCYQMALPLNALPIATYMGLQLRQLFPRSNSEQYRSLYEAMIAEVAKYATDPHPHVSMAHLPFPHSPWVWNRKRNDYDDSIHETIEGYNGNLLLVDRTLGKLRKQMEAAGTWDNTLVIVSSDHHWRDAVKSGRSHDLRIPLLVKLPGQTEGRKIEQRFEAVQLRSYLENVLQDGPDRFAKLR